MKGGPRQLAQANIARGRTTLDDPAMKDFVDQLDYINSVAERAPGFVWRYITEPGDPTVLDVFGDPRIVFNMSAWTSVESLHAYAFRSDHVGPMRDRRKWFDRMETPHSVLWWVDPGTIPTVQDAHDHLALLAEHGPTPHAFTFAHLFDPTGAPVERTLQRDQECGAQ